MLFNSILNNFLKIGRKKMYNFEALKLVNENIKKNKESKKLKNKIKKFFKKIK